jgi:hypothetical protein
LPFFRPTKNCIWTLCRGERKRCSNRSFLPENKSQENMVLTNQPTSQRMNCLNGPSILMSM